MKVLFFDFAGKKKVLAGQAEDFSALALTPDSALNGGIGVGTIVQQIFRTAIDGEFQRLVIEFCAFDGLLGPPGKESFDVLSYTGLCGTDLHGIEGNSHSVD
jgi:hypothetical protein